MDSRHDIKTYRLRVLAVLDNTPGFHTGQRIAQLAGLTYKQTIDALNALNNAERVARTGHKYTARWGRICEVQNPALDLERAFRGFFK